MQKNKRSTLSSIRGLMQIPTISWRTPTLIGLCFALVAWAAYAPHAQAQQRNAAGSKSNRIALVIGNDSYRHISTLRNARADARAMGTALTDAGFNVTVLIDGNEKAMKSALRTFKARISGGDEAVFFYSGHGVQLAGTNYLLPIDLRGDSEDQVKDDAVSLQRVLDDLQDQKARFSLAIIDACRDNPFRQSGRAIGGRGLATTNPATGQMVIYSADTGQQALDRVGNNDQSPNGLFTRVFLKEMEKPRVTVDRVLRGVRDEVVWLAKSIGHDQVPALYDQALGEFYFKSGSSEPVAPIAITAPQVDPRADDRALWESVKDANNAAELQAYLDQFPNGIFAGVARARMKALTRPSRRCR